MILIAKETPHMFMWFSNGSKIPYGISPLPQNARLDYINRLKEECGKLFITKTPAYLVYMGRLLNRTQITLLENLQNEIPNLAVIDYDDVELSIPDQKINDIVAAAANSYKDYERLDVGSGGIADLVDFTRLILLYNSNKLRDIAKKKITIPLEWRKGLIYRDFDVTLEKETMADIPTTHGYMATLNFLEKVNEHHTCLIELAKGNEDLTQRIDIFFHGYIYNLEHYQQILKLFLNRSLNAEEQKAKQSFLLEYKEIFHEYDFEFRFIHTIRIENSFLAISEDEHPLIHTMIEQAIRCHSGYAVVQLNFGRNLKHLDLLKEFLTPQLLGFNIGNDLTWRMRVREQHPSEGLTTVTRAPLRKSTIALRTTSAAGSENNIESQDAVTVNKLSELSKNYLAHLNKASNKNNFRDKYDLMLELNAILDHPSNSPSTKLLEFSCRLQEVDKGILKNHREPNWVMFKKAALFLLGITVVGAIVGLIDYALRGHHSIFFAAKSHGERFILDVEEYIPKSSIN